MFESIIRSGQVREAVRSSCLGPYIDGFVKGGRSRWLYTVVIL